MQENQPTNNRPVPHFMGFFTDRGHAHAVMHARIANSKLWQGKRSRHSRRMRNSQFYVSGKRPMKPDELDPLIKNQIGKAMLSIILPL